MDGELSSESDISVIRFKVEDRGFCFNGPGALQSKRVTEQDRGIGQGVAEQNRGIEDRGLQNRTEE